MGLEKAMSDLKQAAQQALEALHSVEWHGGSSAWMLNDCKVEGAIHALRAALAEPVPDSKHSTIAEWRADKQRKPLTEAEIDEVWNSLIATPDFSRVKIARAIERAHGIT